MGERAIISRSEAKAAGLKRYFTGEACPHGHHAERLVSDFSCCECKLIKNRSTEERERRKEYMAAHQRRYRAEHSDRVAATDSKRYWKDPEKKRQDKRDARAANPELHKEALRKSYQKHRAKRLSEQKLWRIANKAAQLAYMRCFKAMRRANPPNGTFTRDDIEMIFERQDGQCAAWDCQCELDGGFEIDHIQPIAKGGSNWPENLQLLCMPCNRSKGVKTMQEWEDWKVQYKRLGV